MYNKIKTKGLLLLSISCIALAGCNNNEDVEDEAVEKKTEQVKRDEQKEVVKKSPMYIDSEENIEKRENEYVLFLLERNEEMDNYFADFAQLFNGDVVVDEDFMQGLAINIAGIQSTAKEVIEKEDVPEKYEKVHTFYKESMKHYSQAMDDVLNAIANDFDDKYMQMAIENIDYGKQYMQESTRLVRELED